MSAETAVVEVDGVAVRREPEAPPESAPLVIRSSDLAAVDNYAGASLLRMDAESAELLAAPFGDEAVEVKPTGEVFVSQVHYRRRLNQVFGPGQWALVPRGKWTQDGPTMMREYALYARGHFVAEAVGECEYQESNERMSWADAAEGCKSNALTRACKDLGIASECWDRLFANRWRDSHCIQVWVKGKNKPQWRRLDAPAIYGESGPTREWAEAHAAWRGVHAEPMRPPADPFAEPAYETDAEGYANNPRAYGQHGLEPPSERKEAEPRGKSGGPSSPCPKCAKSAGPSKFPKSGKTHYCYACKLPFEPGVRA